MTRAKSNFMKRLPDWQYMHIFLNFYSSTCIRIIFRMRDFLHEYVEQLLDANADDEETPDARKTRLAALQALADYRMVDHVLRSHLLSPIIELRLSHSISLWNVASNFMLKWHNG